MATPKKADTPKPIKPKKEIKKCFKEIATVIVAIAALLLISSIFSVVAGVGLAGVIIFGPNVNDAYGKTGYVVDSHNGYGHYQKGLKIPSSLSAAQSVVRNTLKIVSKLWKGITVNRESFVTYSENHPYMKRGRLIKLKANTWFNEFNINARLAGNAALIAAAPSADFLFPVITSLGFSAVSTPDAITVTPEIVGTYASNTLIAIYVSRPVSAGVMSYKTPQYYFLNTYDPTTTPGILITTDYENKFGAISDSEGMYIWIQAKLVNPLTGETTIIMRNYAEITPSA